MMERSLTPEESQRYLRQMNLPQIGPEGQKKLKEARILLVGAGGLGSPVALYLAAAGVGTLGLVDFDRVDLTNLHRQILYTSADINRPKVEAARERLEAMNPHVQIQTHEEKLTPDRAAALMGPYDLVVDGSDNFPTRYLINDICQKLGKPYIYASIHQFQGQLSVFWPPQGPCYRCLFPTPPAPSAFPNCAEAGVLGVLPGIMGTLQANEALKVILGVGQPLIGRLLCVNALNMDIQTFLLPKDEGCPVCGTLGTTPAEDSVSSEVLVKEIHPQELYQKLSEREKEVFLLDVRTEEEFSLANLGGYLLPLNELEKRWQELLPHREKNIVVYCHHGIRSAYACEFLLNKGLPHVCNLLGGIDHWSTTVDPTVARY